MNITLTPREDIAPRCAVCHDDAPAALLLCPGCRTLIHFECRVALACPTLGCARWMAPSRARTTGTYRPLVLPGEPLLTRILSGLSYAVGYLCVLAGGAAFLTKAEMGQGHTARVERARADMRSIGNALDLYKIDCGRYPEQFQSLWVRPVHAPGWKGPYLKEYPPMDPWLHEYLYVHFTIGAEFEIVSYGADGALGGQDADEDLSSLTFAEQERRAPR